LVALSAQEGCDFGKHVIPYCFEQGKNLEAYEFNGYWKDVGTLGSYWEANMELIDIIPEFNLYEEFWKIYTKNDIIPPQYISADAKVFRSLISDGTEVYGEVSNSIIGSGVTIEAGAVVRDSIIMQNTVIKAGAILDKAIVAENCVIGEKSVVGWGDQAPNRVRPDIYGFALAVVGEDTVIPGGVRIGRNTAVTGVTVPEDYPDGSLASGEILDKAGVVS
jgi:glucose-1-phosphate adenylyltransferase